MEKFGFLLAVQDQYTPNLNLNGWLAGEKHGEFFYYTSII